MGCGNSVDLRRVSLPGDALERGVHGAPNVSARPAASPGLGYVVALPLLVLTGGPSERRSAGVTNAPAVRDQLVTGVPELLQARRAFDFQRRERGCLSAASRSEQGHGGAFVEYASLDQALGR